MADQDIAEYEPLSKLWRFKDHWSGESATYRMGSFSAYVRDYDGDSASWEVKRGDAVLGSGEFWTTYNDFKSAVRAAEECLIEHGALCRPKITAPIETAIQPEERDREMAELEAAEEDFRDGDSGRHSNPGRTARKAAAARERLFAVRKRLIDRGIITADRPLIGQQKN